MVWESLGQGIAWDRCVPTNQPTHRTMAPTTLRYFARSASMRATMASSLEFLSRMTPFGSMR
jgi:hypothetical protein